MTAITYSSGGLQFSSFPRRVPAETTYQQSLQPPLASLGLFHIKGLFFPLTDGIWFYYVIYKLQCYVQTDLTCCFSLKHEQEANQREGRVSLNVCSHLVCNISYQRWPWVHTINANYVLNRCVSACCSSRWSVIQQWTVCFPFHCQVIAHCCWNAKAVALSKGSALWLAD